jgi:hypothetical protein
MSGKKPPGGGFNIDYQTNPHPSKVVVEFLILLGFQKVFTFHCSVSPVFMVAGSSCLRSVTPA